MNQRGYILPFCLLFLLLICTLSLTLITHNHWQQRLTQLVMLHKKQEMNIIATVSQFFNDQKDFSQASCIWDWQQFDQVWQQLTAGEKNCTAKQGNVILRYMLITHAEKQPEQFAVIARTDTQSVWQQFRIQKN